MEYASERFLSIKWKKKTYFTMVVYLPSTTWTVTGWPLIILRSDLIRICFTICQESALLNLSDTQLRAAHLNPSQRKQHTCSYFAEIYHTLVSCKLICRYIIIWEERSIICDNGRRLYWGHLSNKIVTMASGTIATSWKNAERIMTQTQINLSARKTKPMGSTKRDWDSYFKGKNKCSSEDNIHVYNIYSPKITYKITKRCRSSFSKKPERIYKKKTENYLKP